MPIQNMPKRAELKKRAREVMSRHQPSVYLVSLVMVLIMGCLSFLTVRMLYSDVDYELLLENIRSVEDYSAILTSSPPGIFANILIIAISVMSAMLQIGYTIFCLKSARLQSAGFGELFDAFTFFPGFLLLTILTTIFLNLWSLLLIFPGIIAYYRYAMAVYIMIDHPECSAMECIRRSSEMMKGHKLELFLLDFSFIGWYLLTAIPFVSIYVNPYVGLTKACYYEALRDFSFPEEKFSDDDLEDIFS